MEKQWAIAKRGKLCMLWEEKHLPSPSPDDVLKLYDTVFRPTAERDATRLHEAFVAGHRPQNRRSYNDYLKAITAFREKTSLMPLADTQALDNDFAQIHTGFLNGEYGAIKSQCRFLTDTWQMRTAAETAEMSLEALRPRRLAAIATNTGAAMAAIAERLRRPEELATLYAAAATDGMDAARSNATGNWLNLRKKEDMETLRVEMFFIQAEQIMKARAAAIETGAASTTQLSAANRHKIVILYEKRGGVLGLNAA